MEQKRALNRSVFWGLVFILTAALLIANGVGVSFGEGFTPIRIVLGVLLVSWLIYNLIRLRISDVFFPLAFLFLIYEPVIAVWTGRAGEKLLSTWVVLLCALLFTIGFKMLHVTKENGENEKHIGSATLYIDANKPENCKIADNLGNVTVYFINTEQYSGGASVLVKNNLGEIAIHVPRDWMVRVESSGNIGKIEIPERDEDSGKLLNFRIRENLGRIRVLYD